MVHLAGWRALLWVVGECDAHIVDAPYSQKTHTGHGGALVDLADGNDRSDIRYPPWTPSDVHAYVEAWHPRTRGWFVSITDDALAPAWSDALAKTGRYVFSWIPYVAPGSRVRLLGDGPSAWTYWIVVARPRTSAMARWGTLPGAYVLPPGQGGSLPVVGGKPLWLMEQLVRDYSREGDLVCDPCCGAGTTLVAALRQGRRAIGADIDPEHAALAAEWCRHPERPAPTLEPQQERRGQLLLV